MSHTRHQRYWRRFLVAGEQPIHTFGVSVFYVVIFWGVPFLLALVLSVAVVTIIPLLGLLLAVLAVVFLVIVLYSLFFVHYVVTDRRVMSREGVFHKRFVTIDLRSITDVTVNEPFLERVFTKTGTMAVNTAGGPTVELWYRHVRRPFELRRDIYKHLQRAVAKNGRPAGMEHHKDTQDLS